MMQKQHTTNNSVLVHSLNNKLKTREALLFEVGKLGRDYQAWVHTTRVDTPIRFFESNWIEALTVCPWWMVPLVWFPAVSCIVWVSECSLPDRIVHYMSGLAVWPVVEYMLHRFVFHAETESYWANTIHFLLHGNHHVCPSDRLRLVFPPAGAAAISWIINCIISVFYGFNVGRVITAGIITGYVSYDLVHFFIHSGNTAWSRNLHDLKVHHLRHHKAVHLEFGITTSCLDKYMGSSTELQGKGSSNVKSVG